MNVDEELELLSIRIEFGTFEPIVEKGKEGDKRIAWGFKLNPALHEKCFSLVELNFIRTITVLINKVVPLDIPIPKEL